MSISYRRIWTGICPCAATPSLSAAVADSSVAEILCATSRTTCNIPSFGPPLMSQDASGGGVCCRGAGSCRIPQGPRCRVGCFAGQTRLIAFLTREEF